MAIQTFAEGKQFLWQGHLYQAKRLLPGSFLSIENLSTSASQSVFFLDLVKALYDHELQFIDNGRPVQPPDTYQGLSDCPAPLRELAAYRLEVIQPLLTKRTKGMVAARVEAYQEAMAREERPVMAISQGSVYRWIRAYVSSGHDIRALINEAHKQGGSGKSRLQAELDTLITTVIQERFYVRTRVSIDDLYQEVCLRVAEANQQRSSQGQLAKPSRATVGRRVASLDPHGKVTAKRGRQEAHRHFSQVGAMANRATGTSGYESCAVEN